MVKCKSVVQENQREPDTVKESERNKRYWTSLNFS